MGRGNSVTSSPGSGSIASRKGNRDLDGRQPRSTPILKKSPSRGRRSISSIATRLRSWVSGNNMNGAPRSLNTMIPRDLTAEHQGVYGTILEAVAARKARGEKPPILVVITDLAKDYDDLSAMVVLKELHRLGAVQLRGFIANLKPAIKRVQFGRGALDSLGLQEIPIAEGTVGAQEPYAVHDYEFDCDFMADEQITESGDQLLHGLYQNADQNNEKIKLVLLSSLRDIFIFSRQEGELLRRVTNEVVLQGGYTVSEDGELVADESAANNKWDMDAAVQFHKFMQENQIHSTVYTKIAAYATPLTSEDFVELENTGHPIGKHLRKVQLTQDVLFWEKASSPDASKRHMPFMDTEWFLKGRSSWYDKHLPSDVKPVGDEIIPYLNKVVAYDALAALGAAGDDIVAGLKVLSPTPSPDTIHRVIGTKGPPESSDIDGSRMALVLAALMKGALLMT
ncbi:hypothetical protein PVAG01_08941 [Phlyctema vagabunda]|uniref:Reverse transcriptase domain-containing protein n=1 Tax=Phlyctema vagabunda TaxID=108571 RepID=A0ABR4PBA9_9HELO